MFIKTVLQVFKCLQREMIKQFQEKILTFKNDIFKDVFKRLENWYLSDQVGKSKIHTPSKSSTICDFGILLLIYN